MFYNHNKKALTTTITLKIWSIGIMNSSDVMFALSLVIIAQVVVLGLFVNIAMSTNDQQQDYEEYLNAKPTENSNT
ncbi:MAG: hypothetical protein ACI8O8_002842 [Oleiphilaceae bacterium]